MSAVISPLPVTTQAWARFCLYSDATIAELGQGLELLNGPHGAEWLQRGFEATLNAVRNSVAA